jgi:arsenate reductase (thioredoxin)
METDIDVLQVSGQIAASLAPAYEGVLSAATIERFVSESFTELAEQARIGDFLVLLTERMVNEQLRVTLRLAESVEGSARPPGDGAPPEVLLVCGSDATLGMVAAAVLDRLSRGRVAVRLAAPEADGPVTVPPVVAAAAQAAGLDLFRHRLEPLTGAAVRSASVLLTMCAGDACPVVAGKRYLHWGLGPSAAYDTGGTAAMMDEIWTRAEALLAGLPRPVPYLRVVPL